MCMFQFIDYENRVTIRTFSKDVYILKPGLWVQNIETNKLCRLSEIYYKIRTVRLIKGTIIAKRKNEYVDLLMLNSRSRTRSKTRAS